VKAHRFISDVEIAIDHHACRICVLNGNGAAPTERWMVATMAENLQGNWDSFGELGEVRMAEESRGAFIIVVEMTIQPRNGRCSA
jgi:hypothetical protein